MLAYDQICFFSRGALKDFGIGLNRFVAPLLRILRPRFYIVFTAGDGRAAPPERREWSGRKLSKHASCLRHDVICFFITLRMKRANIF